MKVARRGPPVDALCSPAPSAASGTGVIMFIPVEKVLAEDVSPLCLCCYTG